MSISDKAEDNAGEASMDEILASIRKIIADDPSAPRGGPDARSANPLFDNPVPPLRASEIIEGGRPLLPPGPRFDDALRSGPDARPPDARPVSPPLRGRPFADQALAELLDDGPAQLQPPQPAGNAVNAAGKLAPAAAAGDLEPSASARPALPAAGAPDPWAAWRNLRAAASPGSPPPAPVPAPGLAVLAKPAHTAMPPFVNQNLAAPIVVSQSVASQNIASPPLAPPGLAASDQAAPDALDRRPAATQSLFNGSAGDNTPLTVTQPAKPFASFPINPDATPDTAPSVAGNLPLTDPPLTDREKLPPVKTTMPAVKPGFYPPTSAATIRRQPASFASAFPRVTADAPAGAIGAGVAPHAFETPKMYTAGPAPTHNSLDTAALPATNPVAEGLATELIPAAPLSTLGSAPSANRLNGTVPAHSPILAADPTAVAASVALEKLAAGLSAAPSTPAPVNAQVDLAAPASVAQPVSASIPAPRTLDDMVSDLLRPMLEKWVESNMPRLMEKALRPGAPKEPGPPKP